MNLYRELPSVDRLLTHFPQRAQLRSRLVKACRAELDAARASIALGGTPPSEGALVQAIQNRLAAQQSLSLRPVINATGVIIHTNLGRALLSDDAIQAMVEVAESYSNLEYDLEAGTRGQRDTHVEALLTDITGAEAALVVNNNAAAVYLALSGLAAGREVVISRGELVEIGGGFRIPDVMRHSGAHLVEVGTTNRTHLADFAQTITGQTAAFMRVHCSNFKMIGFTESVALAELVTLAHHHQLIVIDDLGSGTLIDTAAFGLDREPTIAESIRAGVDITTFSGDKLLGGPQAGVIVGRKIWVDQLKKHPLARALRPDKLCLAALAMTLKHYQDEQALEKIPVWRMISMPLSEIETRVCQWQQAAGGTIIDTQSTIGGGSLPGNTLPSKALVLEVANPDEFAAALRQTTPPVLGRIQDGRFRLDPRTVLPEQDETLITILQKTLPASMSRP